MKLGILIMLAWAVFGLVTALGLSWKGRSGWKGTVGNICLLCISIAFCGIFAVGVSQCHRENEFSKNASICNIDIHSSGETLHSALRRVAGKHGHIYGSVFRNDTELAAARRRDTARHTYTCGAVSGDGSKRVEVSFTIGMVPGDEWTPNSYFEWIKTITLTSPTGVSKNDYSIHPRYISEENGGRFGVAVSDTCVRIFKR